jgi:putative aminopeptidase FrvX
MDDNIYRTFTEAFGPPSFEQKVQNHMRYYLNQYADEIIQDRLGSIFGMKRGLSREPKVLFASHLDEVGFMVIQITSKGFIRFQTLGGWSPSVLPAQRVEIMTQSGKCIPGVIGSVPPHLLAEEKKGKGPDMNSMFIDIGAQSEEEVREWGVTIGDPIAPTSSYTPMMGGKRILAKAWDNRFGCGLIVELLRSLKGIRLPNTLYAGATVQEEAGLRGAITSANLIKPDVFFAVDVGPAGDTPGIPDAFGEIGKGVLIRIYDRSMITHPQVRDFLLDIAESEQIPYQFFISKGATDAGMVHLSGEGVPSAAIGICGRYIHSHSTIVDREDIEAAEVFAKAIAKKLDKSTMDSFLRY